MAFFFNFDLSKESSHPESPLSSFQSEKDENTTKEQVPCFYINFEDLNLNISNSSDVLKEKCDNLEIHYVTQKSIASQLKNCKILGDDTSDLVPGKYEGGFKVWECSVDLVHYIVKNNCIDENSSVLELGCGGGLPGIAAYMSGASVTFQDFNSEVLEMVTAQNVVLNTSTDQQSSISQKCEFLCGDWECIMHKFYSGEKNSKQFDIILTSETIYEKRNQRKLLNLMKAALKPTGVIYLAAKVHYFGVGGGIADFEELIKRDNSFELTTVLRIEAGVERRILKLLFHRL